MRRYALALTIVVLGCDAYDSDLLSVGLPTRQLPVGRCGDGKLGMGEACDIAIGAGLKGACPAECASDDACELRALTGHDCELECVTIAVTAPRDNDGCCPAGAGPAEDSDCSVCGDGIVGTGETCDPVCPTSGSCESTNACLMVKYTGDPKACTARCVRTPIEDCKPDDGCCPTGCDATTDNDCSDKCGDDVLDTGETCEPRSAVAACPKDCDDGQDCTRDLQVGSPDTCNLECLHLPVGDPIDGDGCCATGLTALNDSDCMPVCGNGAREEGEECDGGELCTANCRSLTEDQSECFAEFATDACTECTCMRCAEQQLRCYGSRDQDRNRSCIALVACSRRTQCVDTECYCGARADCLAPNGPCMDEVENAAESTYGPTIESRRTDSDYAVQRAREYGSCRLENCREQCGL